MMLSDRDSLLRKLHGLRSEHRDLDTVIARLAEVNLAELTYPAETTAGGERARMLVSLKKLFIVTR